MDTLGFKRHSITITPEQLEHVRSQQVLALMKRGMDQKAAEIAAQKAIQMAHRDVLWRSASHEVLIRQREGAASMQYTVRRLDQRPIDDRDFLVSVGERFAPDRRMICVELYPAQSRVIDMDNSCYLWVIKLRSSTRRDMFDMALSTPMTPLALEDGTQLVFVPSGKARNWLAMQDLKNKAWGDDREAVDIMAAASKGLGSLLWLSPQGEGFDFGWRQPQ